MINRELAREHGELIHERAEKARELQSLNDKACEIISDLKKMVMMLHGDIKFDIGANYQIRDQGFHAVFHSQKEIHDILVGRENLVNEIGKLDILINKTAVT